MNCLVLFEEVAVRSGFSAMQVHRGEARQTELAA